MTKKAAVLASDRVSVKLMEEMFVVKDMIDCAPSAVASISYLSSPQK